MPSASGCLLLQVCKIINYDKLRYEIEKKEKLKKKNQKSMDLKEVRTPNPYLPDRNTKGQ